MSNLEQLQEQIEELQSKMAFQDDVIEQLNEIVTKQDAILRKMEQRFVLIGDKIHEMEHQLPNRPFNPVDEKPPHF